MVSDIAPELQSLFMPQVEQLGIDPRPRAFGYAGRAPEGLGTLWVAALGRDCLVTAHRVAPTSALYVHEHPASPYFCVTSLTSAALACCPDAVRRPRRLRAKENIVSFVQQPGPVDCVMRAGLPYACTSVCLLPGFFERVGRQHALASSGLLEDLRLCAPEDLAPALRPLMRALGPARCDVPGAGLFYEAKLLELAFSLVESARTLRVAREQAESRSQRRAVRRVREAVDASLPGPAPAIEQLAEMAGMSRARLCAAFRAQEGESIGAYARRRRMEMACDLLAGSDMPVAEVGRRVGYGHAGSFTDAFERAMGCPPSVWRARGHAR